MSIAKYYICEEMYYNLIFLSDQKLEAILLEDKLNGFWRV